MPGPTLTCARRRLPTRPADGSNINKKVFEGRRMIKPAESRPAVLPGWLLTFNQPGLPFSEPAFAAVELREGLVAAAAGAPTAANGSGEPRQPDAHGVAHRITQAQWQVRPAAGAAQVAPLLVLPWIAHAGGMKKGDGAPSFL